MVKRFSSLFVSIENEEERQWSYCYEMQTPTQNELLGILKCIISIYNLLITKNKLRVKFKFSLKIVFNIDS